MNNKIVSYFENLQFNFLSIYIARAMLAIGTLLSLLFTDPNILFKNKQYFFPFSPKIGLSKISIFYIFDFNLAFAQVIAILILLLVIVGLFPRIMCFFHWWITYSFYASAVIVDGGDTIAMILTLLLIPVLLQDRSSFQWHKYNFRNINEINFTAKTICFFGLHLIRLQMIVLYFRAAYCKVFVNEWRNGTALFYWFSNPEILPPPYLSGIVSITLNSETILKVLTFTIILIELLIALGLIVNREKYNKVLLFAGFIFHIMIGLFYGYWSFCIFMCSGLILATTNAIVKISVH